MRFYETLYIVHPALESGRLKDIIMELESHITKDDGKILVKPFVFGEDAPTLGALKFDILRDITSSFDSEKLAIIRSMADQNKIPCVTVSELLQQGLTHFLYVPEGLPGYLSSNFGQFIYVANDGKILSKFRTE